MPVELLSDLPHQLIIFTFHMAADILIAVSAYKLTDTSALCSTSASAETCWCCSQFIWQFHCFQFSLFSWYFNYFQCFHPVKNNWLSKPVHVIAKIDICLIHSFCMWCVAWQPPRFFTGTHRNPLIPQCPHLDLKQWIVSAAVFQPSSKQTVRHRTAMWRMRTHHSASWCDDAAKRHCRPAGRPSSHEPSAFAGERTAATSAKMSRGKQREGESMPHDHPFKLPPEIQEPLVMSLRIVSDEGCALTPPSLSGCRGLFCENTWLLLWNFVATLLLSDPCVYWVRSVNISL